MATPERAFNELVGVDVAPAKQVSGKEGIALVRTDRDARYILLNTSNQMEAAVEGTPAFQTSLASLNEWFRAYAARYEAEGDEAHRMFAAQVREPIRTLARYKAWTQNFFAPDPRAWGEDNYIPVDDPIGDAFLSSPEGRPMAITPGVNQGTRPTFTMVKAEMDIFWYDLKTAGWNKLARRLEETADVMAKRVDDQAVTYLDAAVAAVTGHTATHATTMDKGSVDDLIIAAAQIGFPITQVALNIGRMMDQTGWTNGLTTALPFYWAPDATREQVFRQLYADGYGNLRYFLSHSMSMSYVYFGGEPAEIGYHQYHEQGQSASAVDIHAMKDEHVFWQDDAWYVGNNYNLWRLQIT